MVPRFGLYNITAAGASGGRGVCNVERGYGTARTVQVELYLNLKLLVLVGQRGSSFCDVEPDFAPCGVAEALFCDDMWQSYIEQETLDGETVADFIGGGGGGGASMVRAYSQGVFDRDPIIIGGGGGGASALLQYTVVNELGINVTEFQSPVLAYRHYINADSRAPSNGNSLGARNSTDRAGTGGGYGTNKEQLDVDGGSLSDARNFALGGSYCSVAELEVNNTFDDAGGGFGGGGGGCGGGGGGGGYLGGRVAGEGRLVPGNGGTSYTGSPSKTSFKAIRFVGDVLNTQFDDGYVDIVHADCECVFKCTVYDKQDAFQCTCPGNSLLADDDSDCYFGERELTIMCFTIFFTNIETELVIEEGTRQMQPPDENGIVFTYQPFSFDSMVHLYSVDFQVVVEETEDDEELTIFETCIVGFLGANNELVAYTDIHRYAATSLATCMAS